MITIRQLNIARTCRFIRAHASRGTFVSYRQICRHYGFAGLDWPYVGPLLIRHLDICLRHCQQNKAPLWPLLAVSHSAAKQGEHKPRRLRQLARGLKMSGDADFAKFVQQQQQNCLRQAQLAPPLPKAYISENYQRPMRYRLVYGTNCRKTRFKSPVAKT